MHTLLDDFPANFQFPAGRLITYFGQREIHCEEGILKLARDACLGEEQCIFRIIELPRVFAPPLHSQP